MTSTDRFSDSDQDRLAAAAAWFARLQDGGLEADDQARLAAWLRAAPENAAALDLVASAWSQMGELAASIALRPDLARARGLRVADGRRPRRRRRDVARQAAAWAATAAACAVLGVFVWTQAVSQGVYATGRGERLTIDLADGTRVRLDADTRLIVRQDPLGRHVRMERGRAEFDVAHETRRAFRVETSRIEVRDIGTRFLVDDRRGATRVVLIEGLVDLHDPRTRDFKAHMTPGQLALINTGGGLRLSRADLAREAAWRDGRMVLDDTPLSQALDDLHLASRARFTLDDPALADLRVSGVFRLSDAPAFLNALSRIHEVRWREVAPDHYRLSR